MNSEKNRSFQISGLHNSAQTDEHGYVVVETVGVFIPFLLLVISILSLVNIIAVQARVHYALTQAANTLSMYSYVLELTEIAHDLTALDNKAYKVASGVNELRSDINAAITGIDSISNIDEVVARGGSAVNRIFSAGESIAGDPKAALQHLMSFSVNELRNAVFEVLARPLVGRYLANGDKTGDEYLIRAGVVNTSGRDKRTGLDALEFYNFSNGGLGNSVLIDRNGNVRLVVEYEIEYTFGGLPLPFEPTLKITQSVITKAWLNGSGEGYW